MANIKSQIKRNRQNEGRRRRNKHARSRLRTRIKGFMEAFDSGERGTAEDAYFTAARELDKAASKGIIHKNRAADKKARLAKKLNALP